MYNILTCKIFYSVEKRKIKSRNTEIVGKGEDVRMSRELIFSFFYFTLHNNLLALFFQLECSNINAPYLFPFVLQFSIFFQHNLLLREISKYVAQLTGIC